MLNLLGKGGAPLHLAASHGYLDIVALLIEYRAAVDILQDFGWTPLHEAARNGHTSVVSLLIENGANPDKRTISGWTPLEFAAAYGWFHTAKLLVEEEADINIQSTGGWTPLHSAIKNGHTHVAQFLIQRNAALKATGDGWTPLHQAAERALFTIMRQLLQRGADVNARTDHGDTALHLCIQARDEVDEKQCLAVVKLLLERGAQFTANTDGWTALHAAAACDYTEIINFLLDQGVDVNVQTNQRITALQVAIFNDSLESAKLLLRRGAKGMDRDKFGKTALDRAVVRERLEFAKSIVERDDCDVNAATDLGVTPLRKAIERGTDEMVEYLISSGARLDALDPYGMRCSDWLKRLRPDFHLRTRMLSIPDIPDYPPGPDMVILRRSLIDLTKALSTTTGKNPNKWYWLAHGFILLGMEDDAQIAYQQNILSDIGPGNVPSCNNCSTTQNRLDPFYTCKTCPESDLCADCMDKYQREPVLQVCRDHDFLKFVASEAKFQPSDTDALNRWLDGIVERFQDTDAELTSSNPHIVAER